MSYQAPVYRELGASRYEADIASTLCQSRTGTHDCYLHIFSPARAPLARELGLTFWFFLTKCLGTVNGHRMCKLFIEVELEKIQS